MSRLFCFGCSYTRHNMPTWADIVCANSIANGTHDSVYNFGRPGLGNMGILHHLCAVDAEYGINSSDTVYIMWSSWNRVDHYVNRTISNVFKGDFAMGGNYANSEYVDNSYLKRYTSAESDILNSITPMWVANRAYNINKNMYLGINDYNQTPKTPVQQRVYNEIVDSKKMFCQQEIQSLLDQLEVSSDVPNNKIGNSVNHTVYKLFDGHPLTYEYAEFVEKHIIKTKLNPSVNHAVQKVCYNLFSQIDNFVKQNNLLNKELDINLPNIPLRLKWDKTVNNNQLTEYNKINFIDKFSINGYPTEMSLDITSADSIFASANSMPINTNKVNDYIKMGNFGVKRYLYNVYKRLFK